MVYENNIIYDAYYLIYKFNQNGYQVSNLQIQKLMYFFEAYYMKVNNNVDKLYDCNFNAWAFGPVAIPLYKEFRKFGNGPIVLTEENKENGNNISSDKKKLLDKMFIAFKDISPTELVNITHMENSPWNEVWKKNENKVGYGADTYIDKLKTKEWFKEIFG